MILPVFKARVSFLSLMISLIVLLSNGCSVDPGNLGSCAQKGDLKKARELIAKKADVNQKFKNGNTALHYAAYWGQANVAKLLLEHGAQVNARTDYSVTPLHFAAEQGKMEVARLLLAKKADVNAKENLGNTPLHWSFKGSIEISRLLISNKADVNIKNNLGVTPLHIAAGMGDEWIVKLLLANKADVNAKNNNGQTPFDFAAQKGHKEVMRLLHSANNERTKSRVSVTIPRNLKNVDTDNLYIKFDSGLVVKVTPEPDQIATQDKRQRTQ